MLDGSPSKSSFFISLSNTLYNIFLLLDLYSAVHPGFPFDSYQISRIHRQQLGKEKTEIEKTRKVFFWLCAFPSCVCCFLRFMFHCWSPLNIGWNQVDSTTSTDFVRCFCRTFFFIIIVLIEIFPLVHLFSCIIMMRQFYTNSFHCQCCRLSIQFSIQWKLSFSSPFMAPFICWGFHFFFIPAALFRTERSELEKLFFLLSYIEPKTFFSLLRITVGAREQLFKRQQLALDFIIHLSFCLIFTKPCSVFSSSEPFKVCS